MELFWLVQRLPLLLHSWNHTEAGLHSLSIVTCIPMNLHYSTEYAYVLLLVFKVVNKMAWKQTSIPLIRRVTGSHTHRLLENRGQCWPKSGVDNRPDQWIVDYSTARHMVLRNVFGFHLSGFAANFLSPLAWTYDEAWLFSGHLGPLPRLNDLDRYDSGLTDKTERTTLFICLKHLFTLSTLQFLLKHGANEARFSQGSVCRSQDSYLPSLPFLWQLSCTWE